MSGVSLQKVNKIYGSGADSVHAVQDLDLEVSDGEFVALLGPSGCGKTSTLRMIVGLESITSGQILFGDRDISHLDPQDRNVAMAFETYALYPNFTVADNLSFPLEVLGLPAELQRKKTDEIAELLRITDILQAYPPELSGGQQQRVSLGRALIREPSVFILDEVMSHLDAHLKFSMLFDLKRLHRELRRTMIYVTHDQVEALALADRVAVMSNARMQQVGDRNTLYNRPANVFVADFIGEPPTNFFRAEVAYHDHDTIISVMDSDLTLQPGTAAATSLRESQRKEVIAGIRPQNLGFAETAHFLTADVEISEYLGERSMLTVVNGTTRFQAIAPPDLRVNPGTSVRLYYEPLNVMLFDPETETLIA
ncbi:MAG: ABC transporter ATP-binding protein [Rhodobacteraceae bacterium]|nr:ABC transporter ATP-binding protein [Paracoccaceae bacterium]MCY4197976.1 ABC transporter ATP-binding protein [Paracoccaceae bacterium]MCY4327285.1 ABC transporter ATP-binding protein [Paracoccaceae bacterium]